MSMTMTGRPLDDPAGVGRALDEVLADREPPVLLALGEPTHGIAAFPLLRNDLLVHLVGRGFRSIALETDFFAAAQVDDYVSGGSGELDDALANGFSHGFGSVPGNRELVQWLRTHNVARPPADRIRFYGFDAPLETATAPSPRRFLRAVNDFLPARLRPGSADDAGALLGDDADWSNPAAMYDAATSIGGSGRASALRIVADDLATALRSAEQGLSPADRVGYENAVANARTAQGLLDYHAAMADSAPDRIGTLLSIRAEMMADNLLAIASQERDRGPCLVFAHNAHLQLAPSEMTFGTRTATWCSAGAIVARTLGRRYLVIVTDANPHSDPATLQGALALATGRRALFPAAELRAGVPSTIKPGEPIVPGHIPLRAADLAGVQGAIFIADTDGRRHRYW